MGRSLTPYLLAGAAMAGMSFQWWIDHQVTARHAAQAQATEAQRLAVDAETARLRERAARVAGDAAQAHLAQTLREGAALTQERTRALDAVTTHQPCLRDPVLRVLDGAPGITVAVVPGAASGAAAARAATAAAAGAPGAPAGVASGAPAAAAADDVDVAHWILSAGQAHEACRAQVQALIEYFHGSRTAEPVGVAP